MSFVEKQAKKELKKRENSGRRYPGAIGARQYWSRPGFPHNDWTARPSPGDQQARASPIWVRASAASCTFGFGSLYGSFLALFFGTPSRIRLGPTVRPPAPTYHCSSCCFGALGCASSATRFKLRLPVISDSRRHNAVTHRGAAICLRRATGRCYLPTHPHAHTVFPIQPAPSWPSRLSVACSFLEQSIQNRFPRHCCCRKVLLPSLCTHSSAPSPGLVLPLRIRGTRSFPAARLAAAGAAHAYAPCSSPAHGIRPLTPTGASHACRSCYTRKHKRRRESRNTVGLVMDTVGR